MPPHLVTSFPNYPSVIFGGLEITVWAFGLFPGLECSICPLLPKIMLLTRPSASTFGPQPSIIIPQPRSFC